jgi:AmiR/NasT family two-component response regulator
MITSETAPERLAAAREAGVSALCSKVFDPQTVCGILGSILARQRPPN